MDPWQNLALQKAVIFVPLILVYRLSWLSIDLIKYGSIIK